uniref:C2 domain-containing protein n=1 Tax=Globodera pallida TaxID=36090 RepID=A0A183CDA2_GLOPA
MCTIIWTFHRCRDRCTDEFKKPVRPEQFNLPSVMAKAEGIRGILFLKLCVTDDSVLKVQVRNGAYFLKSLPISSFVKVEIRRSISSRRRDKYAAAHHHQQQKRRFCSRVTYPALHNNQPEFYEQFTFRISRTYLEHGDKLGISVFVQHSGEEKTPEMLGGMSFSLVKIIKMAHVKLYEGAFFLLPDKKALTTKFAQDKISIRKYYDDIGGCSTSTTSSMGSPFRL